MQKTVQLIEDVMQHVNEVLINPESSPAVRQAAKELLEHLKADLEIAKKAAASQE